MTSPVSARSQRRTSRGSGLWWDRTFRSYLLQAAVVVVIAAVACFFVYNASVSISRQKMHFGFAFLSRDAGFDIGETLIRYTPQDNFARAFLVGLMNTVTVSMSALLLATVLGFAVGICSLSTNRALRSVCQAYVAVFRNVPLLLQLYLWYSIVTGLLPAPKESWNLAGFYISRVGLFLPALQLDLTMTSGLRAAALAIAVGFASWGWFFKGARGSGAILVSLLLTMVAGFVAVVATGAVTPDFPIWKRFRFDGGIKLSPEFTALAAGLSIYTASFIAEIVRAGLLAVKKGQKEAALTLGLTQGQTLRHVIVPQAARVIIPPLTNEYLNLVKNSSLAVAIGYPDLVSVGNTSLNVTGRAIECITIIMAVYLSLSLGISAAMNAYNRKLALRER